ncbi:SAM domain protein [Mollivirus kamchatka]|nr:SAM domain protein [Mollivirus kamchatka]
MSAPTVTMADTTGARAQATGGSLDAVVEAFKIVRQFVGERRCANCTLYQEPSTNDDTHLPVCDERVERALESVGLSHYTSVFAREEIDYEVMTDIHEQDMDRMGITRIGARNKLRRLIDAMRTGRYQDDPRPRILPVDVSKDPASDGFAWDELESPCEPEPSERPPAVKSEPPMEETLQSHVDDDDTLVASSPKLDFYGTREGSPEDHPRRRHKRSRSRSVSRSRDRPATRSPDHRRQDPPKRRRRDLDQNPSHSCPTPRELYASSVITNSLSIRFESPEVIDACASAFPPPSLPLPLTLSDMCVCVFYESNFASSSGEIAATAHSCPDIAPNLALEDAARAVFMTYGTVLSVRAFLMPNRLFVNFARIEDAQRAMETLTGHTDGGHMGRLFSRSVFMVYDYHKMTKRKSFTGCHACTNLP